MGILTLDVRALNIGVMLCLVFKVLANRFFFLHFFFQLVYLESLDVTIWTSCVQIEEQ